MPRATVDFTPEMAALAPAFLPLGIVEVGRETYGGAVRIEIQGNDLEDGKTYQIILTDGPLMRCIELVKSPGQDA